MSYIPNNTAPVQSASLTSVISEAADARVILSGSQQRIKATIFNNSSASLYLRFDAIADNSASLTEYNIRIASREYYDLVPPVYVGEVNGIWDDADGTALVTQYEFDDSGYP